MATAFHELTVADVQRLTDDSAAVTLTVPEELREDFAFAPGQSLTLRRVIDGVDLLDAQAVALLGRVAVSSSPESPLIVVGGPRDQASPGVAALLARCATRVDLAPLRHRTSELAAIASSGPDP